MPPKIHPLLTGQRMRRSGLGALPGGDVADQYPAPNGAPGSLVYPYEERRPLLGVGNAVPIGAPVDPNQPIPPPPGIDPTTGAATGTVSDGLTVPFGAGNKPWTNPTTFQLVPILASSPSATPILSQNAKRNMLLIQNNSSATGAGNTAPTFYIAFNSQASVGTSLALAPGAGILFDIICPRDSVYLTIAGGAGVFVTAGVVGQGTYSPNNGAFGGYDTSVTLG